MKLVIALCMGMAFAGQQDAPQNIVREDYRAWLQSIGSVVSPYLDVLFDWQQEQLTAALPKEVSQDPDKLFVTVDRPLQQTIDAEEAGEVEAGITYGFETYGIIDASVDLALETILFRWGKPIGARGGVTYPVDTVFSFREEKATPMWGPGGYRTESTMRGGGIAKDQNDLSSLLVRGNSSSGYLLVGNFFGPNPKSPTTSSMSIMFLRPTADGKTDFRVSGRYTGQSYKAFGLDFGRKNYGFNPVRVRNGQKDFFNMVAELKKTGKITERKPKPLQEDGAPSSEQVQ